MKYFVQICLNFINLNQDLNLCLGQVQYATSVDSTASAGTVLVFSINNASNFIHFTCLRVVCR